MTRRRDTDLPASPRYSPLEGEDGGGHDADGASGAGSGGSDADGREGERDGKNEERGIELSPDQLSPEALRGLVEEFVSREGTDYGHADRSLESKVAAVHRQLENGEARIVFDLASETASIVATRELERGRR